MNGGEDEIRWRMGAVLSAPVLGRSNDLPSSVGRDGIPFCQ